jgi:hypothetical protein
MPPTSWQSNEFINVCHYHDVDGVHCFQGHLYKYRNSDASIDTNGVIAEPVLLEGIPYQCPACEGRGVILTEFGRNFMHFLQTFAYPTIRDMVKDIMEER